MQTSVDLLNVVIFKIRKVMNVIYEEGQNSEQINELENVI